MGTRCNVILKDEYNEVWFYRHCDGYPDGVKDSFEKFLSWVKTGKIRDNVSQASGWLIIVGAEEEDYKRNQIEGLDIFDTIPREYKDKISSVPNNWKVGAYAPCEPNSISGIEYNYTIDLETRQAYYFENRKKIIVC